MKILLDMSADEVPPEAIKTIFIYRNIVPVWGGKKNRSQMNGGKSISKLPKKGNLKKCINYKGIMLLSVPGKALCRVILECLRQAWI